MIEKKKRAAVGQRRKEGSGWKEIKERKKGNKWHGQNGGNGLWALKDVGLKDFYIKPTLMAKNGRIDSKNILADNN